MNKIILFIYLTSFICLSYQNPTISDISPEQIHEIGENATLNCTVENVDNYAVTWAKVQESGSVVLSLRESLALPDKRYSIKVINADDSKIYSFGINALEASDSGAYECEIIISTTSQKMKRSVKLLIKHPPYIPDNLIQNPYTITEGSKGEITCQAEGFPKPSITWRRENDAIMPGGGNHFEGNTLKFNSAHRYDRGTYFCIADNEIGTPSKKPIQIEVEFKPVITTPVPKVGQAKNYAIELECDVEGFPAPAVSWYRNDKQLQSTGNFWITNNAAKHDITNSVLRISSVGEPDYGDYICKAENKLGNSEARVTLFEPVIPVHKI
ncbi:protein amalgam-like isoform X2 [Condylostylus longicornis]|uniref:protein amalgam-like isoform X2 n=1 Tax=Condylostylus longicornis TaxID=2530218 RepID=UPI00244DC4AE|nr:protein amalgam-like isoform X2 [Condylostylus longicornis]